MIQLRDTDNNLMYPRGVLDILLDTPLQASNSSNTWSSTTLLKSYTTYDIIACRISLGNNGIEGCWVFFFPKVGVSLQEQFSINIYDKNYYFGGKVALFGNNKIRFAMQNQSGWSYNRFYLTKVIGIKMT